MSVDTSSEEYKNAVPFLRAYSTSATDHFYTTSASEMANATANLGYTKEATPCYIFTDSKCRPGLVPLYRLYNLALTDHFYTANSSERETALQDDGYADEGIAGYVYAAECAGTIPLYRMDSTSASDHFYTTSASERDNAVRNLGYADEGNVGYVLPA